MTTMTTREELEDQLRALVGPYKAKDVARLMKVIDSYVVTMAHKLQPANWDTDPWCHLKPGDTDGEVRRCLSCAKVKKLHKSFAWDRRYPESRKLSCTTCLPPKPFKHGEKLGYKCKACRRSDLPVSKFPKAKALNPHLTFHCLDCKPAVV